MSQSPDNFDPQQPDANEQQQADTSINQKAIQGNKNKVVQGNNNRAVLGDNNIVNQGNNNTQNINFIINNYYGETVTNASVKTIQQTKNTLENKVYDFNVEPKKEVRTRSKFKPSLRKYQFEYAEIVKPSGLFGFRTKPIINFYRKEAKYFVEDLSEGVELQMIFIPNGTFFMGSPEEKNPTASESPRHLVSVNSFFISKYPITQKQWKAVASLPQINHSLVVDCSKFKGDSYPIEQVSWDDAVEFCARLSQKTSRNYRLPSEAEWEYAARAGTTTLFHFGDMITPDLANYKSCENTKSLKEFFHNQTTPVDKFRFANLFGLYNMHGLVWEWCMDHWHNSYKRAPNDGTIWLNDKNSQFRVIRGGSWADTPENCRSASRKKARIGERGEYLGFRVVCDN